MSEPGPAPRARLNRERVERAAIALADAGGIGSLTMDSAAFEFGLGLILDGLERARGGN